ncbi:hypothetical protein QFZ25_001234 [Bacillus atrophaeus]|nr:hypothetical protein [Bacillus atrophaeus]
MKDLAIRDDMAPTVSLLYSAAEENMTRLFSIVNHMTLEQLNYKGEAKQKTALPSSCTISQMSTSDGCGV